MRFSVRNIPAMKHPDTGPQPRNGGPDIQRTEFRGLVSFG